MSTWTDEEQRVFQRLLDVMSEVVRVGWTPERLGRLAIEALAEHLEEQARFARQQIGKR